MTQPESLRLADNLEKIYGLKAEAAELRRLYDEVQVLRTKLKQPEKEKNNG